MVNSASNPGRCKRTRSNSLGVTVSLILASQKNMVKRFGCNSVSNPGKQKEYGQKSGCNSVSNPGKPKEYGQKFGRNSVSNPGKPKEYGPKVGMSQCL